MMKLMLIFTLVFASSAWAKVNPDDRTEAADVNELECTTGFCGDKSMRGAFPDFAPVVVDQVADSIFNEGKDVFDPSKPKATR